MPDLLDTTQRLDTQDPPNPGRGSADRKTAGRVGRVICGKWHVDALLGVGGMASVYAATHRNGRRAALKMLHASAARDPDVVARFLREGYLANAVGHPAAVGVLDDDLSDDGTAMLVMELLEGETLEARLERGGPIAVEDALAIADELCDVLAAAHDSGIVHRDVKPDNVFLQRDGSVRLLDFGIARLCDARRGEDATRTGLVMGTPAFMPPEQIRGSSRDVTPRSDLWAVGAMLFTMLTGRHVHDADNAADLIMAIAFDPAPPLCEYVPEAAPEVAAVVDRALRFEPTERWPDARAMQRAIREAREALWRGAGDARDTSPSCFEPWLEYAPTDDGSGDAALALARASSAAPPVGSPVPLPMSQGHTEPGRFLVATAAAAGMLALKVVAACALVGQLCAVAAPAARDVRDPVVLAAGQ